MEKLEIKHIAPYLPYGLRVETPYGPHLMLSEIDIWEAPCVSIKGVISNQYKPILRPLSDLTKEITHNGETFVPIERMKEVFKDLFGMHDGRINTQFLDIRTIASPYTKTLQSYLLKHLPAWASQKLFEWHFDVFGLIEKGLAVDINTL